MNYFQLFEMPVSLTVSLNELEQKYTDLIKKNNEFILLADNTAQIESKEKSFLINKGYAVLKDDDEIIKYVLQIKGLLQEDEFYELSPGFLEELKEENDLKEGADILIVEEMKIKLATLQKAIYEEVQNIIENFSDDNIMDAQLLQVKDYFFKKKYIEGLLERLNGMRNIASQK